jgi:Tol biopolymer transport system component
VALTIRTEQNRIWGFRFDPTKGQVLGSAEAVTPPGIDVAYADMSDDGRHLVYRSTVGLRQRLLTQAPGAQGQGEVLVEGDVGEQFAAPHWSRDGSHVACFLRGIGGQRMVVYTPGTAGEQVITSSGTLALPSDWSLDGQWILGGGGELGSTSIQLFPLSGAPAAEKQARVVASKAGYNLWQARFSPDDRWVSFHAISANEAGVSTIYVTPHDGGPWIAITDGRSFALKARWSPDGRTLYFLSDEGGTLNVWGRRFDPQAGRPTGDPFRVLSTKTTGHTILPSIGDLELIITRDRLVLPMSDVSGHIWILENVGR